MSEKVTNQAKPHPLIARLDWQGRQEVGDLLADALIAQMVAQVYYVRSTMQDADATTSLRAEDYLCDGIVNRFDAEIPHLRKGLRDDANEGEASALVAKFLFGGKALPPQIPEGVAPEEAFRIAQVYLLGMKRYRENLSVSEFLRAATIAAHRVMEQDREERKDRRK